MDRIPTNQIAAVRRALGWSQRELAVRSGVSRAEVSAIETGRQSPSISTALRLAESLSRTVEELFTRREETEPTWAFSPAEPSGRFWEARVGTRTIRIPVEPTLLGSLPHDGRVGSDGVVRHPWTAPERTLVIAGCDPAVGLLAAALARTHGVRLIPLTRGSRDALALVEEGLVHAAGVHWSDASDGDANTRMVLRAAGPAYRLLHVNRWQEGVALESSVRARTVRGLKSARLRWIAREEGSGARHVLDQLLGPRTRRFRHEARDHGSVALAIRNGYAQAGVAVRMAAEEHGLDFVALTEEDYELCYPDALAESSVVAALRETLRQPALARLVRDLPGQDPTRMGEERNVSRHERRPSGARRVHGSGRTRGRAAHAPLRHRSRLLARP